MRHKHFTMEGDRHSSVVSSTPTILWPRVRIPSTPSTLFSICIIVSRKWRNKQKETRIGPFLKKTFYDGLLLVSSYWLVDWNAYLESVVYALHNLQCALVLTQLLFDIILVFQPNTPDNKCLACFVKLLDFSLELRLRYLPCTLMYLTYTLSLTWLSPIAWSLGNKRKQLC